MTSNEYISILEDYSIHDTYSTNHKKYLKELLKEHIPAIQFIKSVRRNESEMVSLSLSVSQAMEEYSQTTSVDALVSVAKVLREDILNNRNWKFSTGLGNSKNPPMLQFLLNQILFGPYSKKVTGRRDIEVKNTVDVACQFLIQYTQSDRQVKHFSKKDKGFRCRGVETPLSVG